MLIALGTFLLASLGSYLIGFPATAILRARGVFDRPNDRSSHLAPTVRGGGLGFIAVILVAGLFVARDARPMLLILLAATLVAVMSFIDDLRSLGPMVRFGCHLIAAGLGVWALGDVTRLDLNELAGGTVCSTAVAVVALLWVTGYTNAFNFMDGINGLAAGQAFICGFGTALILSTVPPNWQQEPLLLSLAVAGGCLGFLPHNFPHARMFMGDAGSAPLGFLLAVAVLWVVRDQGWALVVPLALLHANFVLDTGFTFLRRVLRGERWCEAHREHFYQRLVRSGRSHTFVTGSEMALQLIVLALLIVYLHSGFALRVVLVAVTLLLWAGFFAFCEWEFNRSRRATVLHTRSIA